MDTPGEPGIMNARSANAATLLASLLLIANTIPRARAEVVQEYIYAPGKTFSVRTALGITTQIVLIGDDEVEDYSVGFSGGWDVSRRGNVLYVRPRNVDVDTNMIVRTRTRTYIIELKVVASNWRKLDQAKQAGVQYRVAFTAANGQPPSASSSLRAVNAAPAAGAFDSAKNYVFDYDVARSKGADALVPQNVYDDGAFTFLRLKRAEGKTGMGQPAVFARRTANGGDMIVNNHVEGNTVIVHGVYPFLALRNGSSWVLIRRNGSTQ